MREFFQEIESAKTEEVVLDFSNIEFISRSCADEYLSLKSSSSKVLKEKNVSYSVSEMIKEVRKSRENFFQVRVKGSQKPALCYN